MQQFAHEFDHDKIYRPGDDIAEASLQDKSERRREIERIFEESR